MKNSLTIALIMLSTAFFAQDQGTATTGYYLSEIESFNFNPPSIKKLFPDHIGGDMEFDGNGPKVEANVKIRISGDQKTILADIEFHLKETKNDWTEAYGQWTYALYDAPVGKKIVSINSPTTSKTNYTDTNHALDRPPVTEGELVNYFEINGDTNGNDVFNQTNDDSYLNIYFNPVNISLTNEGETSSLFPENGYQIKSKDTRLVLDVRGGHKDLKTKIWSYRINLTSAQRFNLIEENGDYLIQSNLSDLYLTVKKRPIGIRDSLRPTENSLEYKFSQDTLYPNLSYLEELAINSEGRYKQRWKLIPTGEIATYYIESKKYPGMVIEPTSTQSGTSLQLVQLNYSPLQKWIIQLPRREQNEANYGYGTLWVDAPGAGSSVVSFLASLAFDEFENIRIVNDNFDVNSLAPQHRSVGETFTESKPLTSYQILEGVVDDKGCKVADMDFPSSHYTHDMDYDVIPTAKYEHLLSWSSKKGEEAQKKIEVEWETGLGQNSSPNNPARTKNIRGESFGYFTQGHQRSDIIWNWPTPGDSVHVEGLWIWERGHSEPHTEIHPPHFVAIKRKLPVSFSISGQQTIINNNPQDMFYGQEVDIYASGDGSVMWNSMGLEDFSQAVNMKRKDYSFNVRLMFSKPLQDTNLKWRVIKHGGNTFNENPNIEILSDGTTVRVSYPWKSRNIPDTAKIAQSIIFYWDDASTKGVLSSQKPNHISVNLKSIYIRENGDPDVTYSEDFINRIGECVLYCNIGSKWIFLNEFATNEENVLENGLGSANDETTYPLNVEIDLCVFNNSKFRVFCSGWESDHINSQMGNVISEYNRNKNTIGGIISNIFSVSGMAEGTVDDPMGEVNEQYSPNYITTINEEIKSNDGNNYTLKYDIIKIQ